jgi:cytoskeletal protein CcmA (bactofilin family)
MSIRNTDATIPDRDGAKPAAGARETDRKLVVGEQIVLSGEIKSCSWLAVQGTITADLAECRQLDIARDGTFTGTASVEHADIDGRFEGKLTVTGRLRVRKTGVIKGTIRYEAIEVECGGQISGDIRGGDAASSERDWPGATKLALGGRGG